MRAAAAFLALALLAGCDASAPTATAPVARSSPPTAVSTPPPAYPEALACNGVGGTVQLRVRIETDGRIRQVELQQGSGNAELDAAAQAAVKNWTFRPAMQAGKPVAQWIAVPMNFRVPPADQCEALKARAADALKAG